MADIKWTRKSSTILVLLLPTFVLLWIYAQHNFDPLPEPANSGRTDNSRSNEDDYRAILKIEQMLLDKRLEESGIIWERSVQQRHKSEASHSNIFKNPWDAGSLKIIWDYFYPSYNCPHSIERLGRTGDGGKWVCGVSHLKKMAKKCVVYSYGVAGDDSFEQDILSRTECTLRAFDHTVNASNVELIQRYPDRSTFHQIGLGVTDSENMRTLKTEMELHGDTFVDILKVDVEGGEFELLPKIIHDFPQGLPFGQLLIELHLNSLPQDSLYQSLKIWWEKLEAAGLRAFEREPNLYILYHVNVKHPFCYEYSFVNTGVDHVLFHA